MECDYFIKLCEQIYTYEGEFHFPFGKIQLDSEYEYIIESDLYFSKLEDKMNNYLNYLTPILNILKWI